MLTIINAQLRKTRTHTHALHAAPFMNRKDKMAYFLEWEVGGNVEEFGLWKSSLDIPVAWGMNLMIKEWGNRKLEKVKTKPKASKHTIIQHIQHWPCSWGLKSSSWPCPVPRVLAAQFLFVLLMPESLTKPWASGGQVLASPYFVSHCGLVLQSKCLLKWIEIKKCLISLNLFFF